MKTASLRQKALARLQLGSICFKNALILKEDIWSKTSLVLEFLALKLWLREIIHLYPRKSVQRIEVLCSIRRYSSLFVTIRHYSSLFVTIRHYSSLFVTIRHYSSLFVAIRDYLHYLVTIRHYSRIFALFGLYCKYSSVFGELWVKNGSINGPKNSPKNRPIHILP